MPIVMPTDLRLNQTAFELRHGVQVTPLRGGGALAVDFAPARWAAEFSTPGSLRRAEIDEIVAFVDALRGGLVRVEIFDWLRKWPRAYGKAAALLSRVAGGLFDGDATVDDLSSRSVTISGLPAAYAVSAGDMIGLREGEARSLHRVSSAVTASAGGMATIAVEPAVPIALFSSPTARLVAPTCIMQIVDQPTTTRDLGREGASFKLVQVPV